MDIRKFFGGAGGKKGPVGKSASKNATTQKLDEKVKNKLSSFQRDKKEVQVEKTDKSQNNNNDHKKISGKLPKKIDSKAKSNGGDNEDIIIEDSDDDVIPCSLNSTLSTTHSHNKGKSTNSKSSSKRDTNKSEAETKSSKLKDKSDRSSKSKNEKPVEHKKEENSTKKAKEPELKKEDSVRKSPRKHPPRNDDKNGRKATASQKSKHIQISDDDSDEVSVIKESSFEDDEEVIASIKRRTSRKRGRKANNVLDSDSDDEDPIPKKTPQSKKKKKSGLSFVHDSDDEKIETVLDKFVKKKATPTAKEKVAEPKKETPKKTQVNVSAFFGTGSASASRVERPSIVDKRKREESNNKTETMKALEDEIQDDDDEDFLKVMDEMEGPDLKKMKLSPTKQNDASTPKASPGSLASKLASKMKADSMGSMKEDEDGIENGVSSSPAKKNSSPQKTTTTTTQKHRKSYTLEVTQTKTKNADPVKVEAKSNNKTPQKPLPSSKPVSSEKKNTDKEDDGFGAKKGGSFRAYKMRGGPLALGSKEMPEGEENCLEGLTFVITGVLDSIERDDAKSMVEKYGGKVTTSLSKKTSYLVVGREPGDSKLNKAKDLKVTQIDEDGLFDLVRTKPGKTSKYELQAKEQLKKEESLKLGKKKSTSKKLESFQHDKPKDTVPSSAKPLFTKLKSSEEKPSNKVDDEISQQQLKPKTSSSSNTDGAETLMWVDKHKPSSLKQIIGQQGEKSNAHKLLHWIQHWHQNVIVKGIKASGNFFGKGGGDGKGFRAALLSGPPGIGKTTTATLVCKEAGFSYVELNASDTRSKKSLNTVIAESLNNQTLIDFIGDEKKKSSGSGDSQHHCLIMDEVDGMAGNEDRGGLQELVQLIKSTKIPIICICNDRNSMKMRTLSNHCFDLRFQRPRVEQIKGAMMTLAFREGIKIPPSAVQEMILAANHDIRQTIHNLSMWSATDKKLTFEQVKEDAKKAQKDLKLGPFDVCRKVFVSDEETRKMTINDKSDLFFHDYSFAPLFVHENYPHVIPSRAEGNKSKHMACLARTVDSLCDGDLVEKLIRNQGNWNLLPIQAMYSSVLPGEFMRGSFPQMTNFPSWLGKNSTTKKTDRILQELGMHMGLKISCDKRGLNHDYLPALRMCLTAPLASHGADGVPGVIQMMDDYDIIKDDFDNIQEVSKWPNSVDYMARVESKTKAALTRMYNKSGHMTPYSSGVGGKKKRGRTTDAVGEEDLLKEEEEEGPVAESEEEDDEPAIVAKPKGKASKGKQDVGSKGKGKAGGSKGRK